MQCARGGGPLLSFIVTDVSRHQERDKRRTNLRLLAATVEVGVFYCRFIREGAEVFAITVFVTECPKRLSKVLTAAVCLGKTCTRSFPCHGGFICHQHNFLETVHMLSMVRTVVWAG